MAASNAAHAFSGQKPEAPAYPPTDCLSRFGIVSDQTHRQGLSPLSWLSFSSSGFVPPFRAVVDPIAEPVEARSALSPAAELPTPAKVHRAAPHGVWPDPPWRDSHPFESPQPEGHRLRRCARVCPRRPVSRGTPSDRTPGLIPVERTSLHETGLYSDEPPSNRTSTSRCIRLYESVSRWLVRPSS